MIEYSKIIDKYYPEANRLRDILLVHSTKVAEYAVKIVDRHPELDVDRDFVYAAAMLHDIGITRCDAPGIECFGTEPYIKHGLLGGMMLRELLTDKAAYEECCITSVADIEPFARVCERHTGTGLTAEQIITQNLPLPHQDLTPETLAEQIICYADKFFSKTHPDREKTYEQAERSLQKFGEEGILVFRKWHQLFSANS